jgi:hypothetical protein
MNYQLSGGSPVSALCVGSEFFSDELAGKSCHELATLNKEASPSICTRTGQEVEVGSRGEICIRKEDMVTHTYIGDHQVGKIKFF